MADGDYEVRNRHGDVIQRGEVDIVDVHEVEVEGREVKVAEIEHRDIGKLRDGDRIDGTVDLRSVLED